MPSEPVTIIAQVMTVSEAGRAAGDVTLAAGAAAAARRMLRGCCGGTTGTKAVWRRTTIRTRGRVSAMAGVDGARAGAGTGRTGSEAAGTGANCAPPAGAIGTP